VGLKNLVQQFDPHRPYQKFLSFQSLRRNVAPIQRVGFKTRLASASTASRKLKTGKVVRYRFSEGGVLFLLVITEFPFPLKKEDKDSLAKVLAHGGKTAKHGLPRVRISFFILEK